MKIECTREVVRLRKLSSKHADEIAFLESLKFEVVCSNTVDPTVVKKIDNRIAYLELGHSNPEQTPEEDGTSSAQRAGHMADFDHMRPSLFSPAKAQDGEASILSALEYMAWGRTSGECFPHLTCSCQHRQSHYKQHGGSSIYRSHLIALDLPSASNARKLVTITHSTKANFLV